MSHKNISNHCVIGIDLGGTKIYGALVDLNGKILHDLHFDHHQNQSEESLRVVCDVIDVLLDESARKIMPVSGIGVGVPGITNPESGMVSFAPALGWQDFPLAKRLRERYPYPVLIENDVNLAALGEAWFAPKGEIIKNLVLIAIGTGIGAGIVINGAIYSGVNHMAGEIGYLLLDRSQLGRKYPGFGAFEGIASGTGIAERARQYYKRQFSKDYMGSLSAEAVFMAARKHEGWAETTIAETNDYLAQAIAAISLLYDPEVILLGGGVSNSADLLIGPILKRLEGRIPLVPQLSVSSLGYRGAILGAVYQLQHITSQVMTI